MVITADVKQSSRVQGALNTVTFQVAVNRALLPGDRLIFSGLKGAQRPIATSIPIQLLSFDLYNILGRKAIGQWDLNNGVLSLTLAEGLPAAKILPFKVDFYNGYINNPNNVVSVNVTDSRGSAFVPATMLAAAQNDTGGLLSVGFVKGSVGGRILQCDVRSWMVAFADQASVTKCTLCSIVVRIQPSSNLAAGSVITIAGLTGSPTISTATLAIDDKTSSEITDPADKGDWAFFLFFPGLFFFLIPFTIQECLEARVYGTSWRGL